MGTNVIGATGEGLCLTAGHWRGVGEGGNPAKHRHFLEEMELGHFGVVRDCKADGSTSMSLQ